MASLFGITLNDGAAGILDVVVTHYGTAISEREHPEWERDQFGHCCVAPDGTPIIEINPETGRTQTNLVHELFHLHLEAIGYPVTRIADEIVRAVPMTQVLRGEIWNTIQHSIFFPHMREQGLDPDAVVREGCRQAMAGRGFGGAPGVDEKAVRYFRASVETHDGELQERLPGWYQQREPTAYSVGQQMAEALRSTNPGTPKQAVNVLVNSMNILFTRYMEFYVAENRTEQLGRHVRHVVILSAR